MFKIGKAKISSWDDLKKTKEAEFELDEDRTILLRGVTEGERRAAVENSTEMRFDKELKKDVKKTNDEELGYHLIITGWVEPEIPGGDFKQKKESLDDLGYALLQKIALKINELSGMTRKDIDEVKNLLGPS